MLLMRLLKPWLVVGGWLFDPSSGSVSTEKLVMLANSLSLSSTARGANRLVVDPKGGGEG